MTDLSRQRATLRCVCLIATTALGLSTECVGRDVYVATTGSDSAGKGTISAPYRTPAKAVAVAKPGDVIILRQGSYTGGLSIERPNITIRSYENEWAKLIAPTDDEDEAVCVWFDMDSSGGRLQRLEIVGGYYYAVKTESNWDWGDDVSYGASRLLIEDCRIHGSGRDCVKIVPGSDDVVIRRSEIYDSGVRDSSNAEGIDNVNGDRMLVQDCYLHDIATNGIYFKGGATGCIVERCLIMNCGEGGVMAGFYTDEEWFDTDANPDYYESIDGTVRNCIIVNANYAGIGLYGATRPRVLNNTIVNTARQAQAAILINQGEIWIDEDDVRYPPCADVVLINNVVSQTSGTSNPIFRIREGGLTGKLDLSNNRYYVKGKKAVFEDDRQGNSFYGGFQQWKKHIKGETGSSEGDPKLDAEYHLTSASACVNAGRSAGAASDDYDGGTRPAAVDIGADERGGESPLDVPPPADEIGTGGGRRACMLDGRAVAPSGGVVGGANSFDADATGTGSCGNVSYLWNFGDGKISQARNATHAYTSKGTFGWAVTASSSGADPWTKSGSIEVLAGGTGLPDVAALWQTAAARAGAIITTSLRARNIGNAPAGPCTLTVYFSADTLVDISDLVVAREAVNGLAAGATSALIKVSINPSTMPAGKYAIAVLDSHEAIRETDEENNTAAKKVR